jgi:peptidoglycan/xylan/chitin deacetylase (PgdA/CDA1 family)
MNAHTDFNIYVPAKSLPARISRRLVKYRARRPLKLNLERPIVSISFDDCPRSVFETALPAMEKRGWKSTIYAAMGLCDTTNHLGLHMSAQDMKTAYEAGHEIADHTFAHIDANAVSSTSFLSDIEKNQDLLKSLEIPPSRSFAYPYGEVSFATKTALSKRFDLMRGIHSPTCSHSIDLNQAASQRLFSGSDFEQTRQAIRRLEQHPSWLILFTHDVRENPSEYGCTPSEFETILSDLAAINADVLPVIDALETIRGSQ